MKQIKTIVERRDFPEVFDSKVNKALSNGWVLIRRYISNGKTAGVGESRVFYPILVAEMEKEITPGSED